MKPFIKRGEDGRSGANCKVDSEVGTNGPVATGRGEHARK